MLGRVAAVHLAARVVVEVEAAAPVRAFVRRVGARRDGLGPHRGRGPERRDLPRHHAAEVGVERHDVDGVPCHPGAGSRGGPQGAAVLDGAGRRVEPHGRTAGRELRVAGDGPPRVPGAGPVADRRPVTGRRGDPPALDRLAVTPSRQRPRPAGSEAAHGEPRARRDDDVVGGVAGDEHLHRARRRSPTACPGSSAGRSRDSPARPWPVRGRRTARAPCRGRSPARRS